MNAQLESALERLQLALKAEIRLDPVQEGIWSIDTPLTFPDGDSYSLYLQQAEPGKWKISDLGNTWMRLSYDNDVDKFRAGTRGRLLAQVLAEGEVQEEEGEFYVKASTDGLGKALFRLAHTISRVYDLTFLNRERAEGTFLEDLQETLRKIIPFEHILTGYSVPGIPEPDNYPVDFRIEGPTHDLFVFAVPNRDKARLTTIYLHHYLRHKVDFESLVVFQDLAAIPRGDLARLTNTGGDIFTGLDDADELKRKILKRTGTFDSTGV